MLEIPNYCHVATSIITFESLSDFVGAVVDRNNGVITFFLKYLPFRRPGEGNFPDIIKLAIMLLKQPFKTHKCQKN